MKKVDFELGKKAEVNYIVHLIIAVEFINEIIIIVTVDWFSIINIIYSISPI